MKDYLTVSEQAALLGEDPEDACGCEHPFEDHVACALNPSGPWHQVRSRCLSCLCCLDAGGYYVDSPLAPDGQDWLVYQILPDAYRHKP
jgi:hypothetical protein